MNFHIGPAGNPPGRILPAAGLVKALMVLVITHPTIRPEKITRKLRLKPVTCGTVGDRFGPYGRVMTQTQWIVTAPLEIDMGAFDWAERINETLRAALRPLRRKPRFVRRVAQEGSVRFSLSLPASAGIYGMSLAPDVTGVLAVLGVTLGVDLFPSTANTTMPSHERATSD